MDSSVPVKVAEHENENGIEITAEKNMSLKVETVSLKFPECFALAYKSGKFNKWKAVEMKNEKFLPPEGGWGTTKYICIKGKKIKFKLTNLMTGLTEKNVQEYLESYGIVEVQKFITNSTIAYAIIQFITDAQLENIKMQQHPFTIEEVLQPDKEKFTKRSGTTNMGHKFEELTMASLLLNLTLDEEIQDFRISSNDEEFGSFDDIVVDIELTNGDVRKSAIQLKYKNHSKQSLKKYLTSVNGDFSIQKYFKDFTNMIEYTKNYNLILFTNLKFGVQQEESLKLDNTNIDLQIVEQNLPKEFGEGFGYKFYSSKISNQYKRFFDKFLVYPNQLNVETMEQNIYEKFNTEFSFNNIGNYLKFISEWCNKEKKYKNKINKTFIKELIALQMLSKSIKSFPVVEKGDDDNSYLLKKAIFEFTVTVVDKKYSENIKKIWENETMNGNEIKKLVSDFQLRNLGDDEKRVVALWIMNRCPLIITESKTAYKVISLCSEKHFVLLINNDTAVPTQNLKVFTKLTDLDSNSILYKDITKKFRCSIQGKHAINLEDLINQCGNFETFVTTNELIQMLDGLLLIGKQETILDIYIHRLVTRLTIENSFFDYIDKDTLVIISCQGNENLLKKLLKNYNLINIEDYLNDQKKTQLKKIKSDNQTKNLGSINEKSTYFSKNQCTRNLFDIVCKRNSSKKKCHHFRIIEDGVLEWMYSEGEISDLQKYKTNSSFLQEKDLFNIEETINIIAADPGMGKTELMKKFSNMYLSSFWTVLIQAKDLSEYLKQEGCSKENLFEIIFKNTFKTKFEENIVKVMQNAKRITFLWDGLDELSSTQIDNAINLIDDILKDGFKQWISCRKHLENKLEKKFNVLSRSLKQFDKDEQRNYIYRRLRNKEINLEEVVHKIQNYVDRVQFNEILGIPLQIFMLTELLLNHPKLLHTLLNEVFPITDLYKYFIDMKFEFLFKAKYNLKELNPLLESMMTDFQKEQLKYHQKTALAMIFENKSLLEKLDISLNSTISNEETIKIYGIGIITEKTDEGKSKFLHYSYAEYFVALYFYENRNKFNVLLKELIFQENFQNIRFMFDLLLARRCPAHLAVLYNNFDYLKSCQDYSCKDEGGRNPLQIACAWGARFPLLKTIQEDDYFLIDDEQANLVNLSSRQYYDEMLNLLLDHNDVLDKDLFFHLNSIEYADLSLSFKPLVMFSKDKSYFSFHTLENFKDIFTVLYYSVKFNYSSVLYGLSNIPVLQTIKNCNTILHLASENNSINCIKILLKDKIYLSKVNTKNQNCETPIYLAVQNGHYEVVKYLAESGADVNIPNHDGWVPIHRAAYGGHIEIVKFLINDLKANVNAKNKKGFTPICFAAQNGHYETVKYLAELGANVNIENQNDRVPIHTAAHGGYIEVVKLLANDLKVNVNVKDNEGFTPIYLAARNGHYDVVKYLAELGADVNIQNENGRAPIHTAAYDGHIEVVKLIINDLKANVNAKNKNGSTPICFAAQNGHYEIVKCLAELGANVNIQNPNDRVPIHIAAYRGHIEVVKLLVNDLKANVNVKDNEGFTPIYLAAQNGHCEVVKYLAELGANVNIQNPNDRVPIHTAAHGGHIEVVKFLVNDLKANVNVKDNEGFTPIYLAARNGHYGVVKYLAELGADVNMQNQNDKVPIHIAAYGGHIKVVKLLVNDLKANVNVKDNEGFTPIYLAAHNGHYEIVKHLAELGANVSMQNQNDRVPIHIAAYGGHIKVVKLLVNDLKANVNVKDNEGFTPIYLAARNGHYDVVKYLAELGADVNIQNQNGWVPIHTAVFGGHIEVVKLLVNDLKVDVNVKDSEGFTPMYTAAQNGHYDVVKFLTESGADVNNQNIDGRIPIHTAAHDGHIEVVKLLANDLKANVNVKDNEGFTPIYFAAQNGYCEVIKYLAELGADANIQNQEGRVPIHTAALNGHIEVVTLLINDLTAKVNAKNNKGFTPICFAAHNGQYEIVKYLAELGANVNMQNQNDRVPIHLAAYGGHIKVVKLLVNDLKANVNVKDNEGFTPVYLAARNGHYDVVKYLAEFGADVNVQNQNGWVPLQIAARNGHIQVAKLLANVNSNFTSVDHAGENGRDKVVQDSKRLKCVIT